MKILITGSNGLLGQKLVYKLKQKPGVELIATARGEKIGLSKEFITRYFDAVHMESINHQKKVLDS